MGQEGEVPQKWPPLEDNQDEWLGCVSKEPQALTSTSLPQSRRDSKCKLFSRGGTDDPGLLQYMDSGGEPEGLNVAWDPEAVATMSSSGGRK